MKPLFIRHTGDRRIFIRYADGLGAEIDFTGYFEARPGPVTEPLLQEEAFAQGFLDHGILTWPSGYDIDADVLRLWCERGCVLPASETQAAFGVLG